MTRLLRYGSFTLNGAPQEQKVGVALADSILDLNALADAGRLGTEGRLVRGRTLQPLLEAGHDAWVRLGSTIEDLVERGAADRETVPMAAASLYLPFEVGDFVDFYSSIEHATNLGRIFRPHGDPLFPNYRHQPVGYHGRSATVAITGTPVRRPRGQMMPAGADAPVFGPTKMLDFELEVGFVTGTGPPLGGAIAVEDAERYIFGLVLVNDWSARDIQAFEYQPLGPFLGKSFLTSVSPWVVPLHDLRRFRVPGPVQEPVPLPYLRAPEPRNLDLRLEVSLRTGAMASAAEEPVLVSSTSFAGMYWSMSQQLAHLTANGARIRAGDLCASGTVSGPSPATEGSLIELTQRGTRPLVLANGEARTFLEDGDEVTLRGWFGDDTEAGGRLELGTVTGRVEPRLPDAETNGTA